MITRRDFLSLVAVAAPLVKRAPAVQPRDNVWRLGYLVLNPLADPPSPERAAFVSGLRELGYAVGSNLTIEYRSAESDKERLPFLADELVQAKVGRDRRGIVAEAWHQTCLVNPVRKARGSNVLSHG